MPPDRHATIGAEIRGVNEEDGLSGLTVGGVRRIWSLCSLVLLLAATAAEDPARAGTSTPWIQGYNSQVRLIAGGAAKPHGGAGLLAGVEIRLAPGWKTYWRMPGDAGGVPPHFDWSGSGNLASARVLYPAPHRLKDAAGDSVGYTGTVLFPIEITASDPSRPVELRLALDYGICREICVPAQASLDISIPPEGGGTTGVPSEIAAALASVPRSGTATRPQDPRLGKIEAELTGAEPKLTLEVAFPAGASSGDAFVEAPEGLFLALPARAGERDGTVRFVVDLSQGVEPAELKGTTLVITAVSDAGQSETSWTVK